MMIKKYKNRCESLIDKHNVTHMDKKSNITQSTSFKVAKIYNKDREHTKYSGRTDRQDREKEDII